MGFQEVVWEKQQWRHEMLRRLLAELRLWEEAIAGLDDPFGDYLLGLEERVAGLERDLAEVRKFLPELGAVGDAATRSSSE